MTNPSTEMKVRCRYDKMVDVNELRPHPKNRNTHDSDQIQRLSKLLEYQGVRAPIVVSNLSGYMAKGHGTLMAIRANGWNQAPVVYQDFDNQDQEYLFLQSDNAIASWSILSLADINQDLAELGPDIDIDLLGIKDFLLEPMDKMPTDSDWADKFDQAGDTSQVDGHVQITFRLKKDDHSDLMAHLKTISDNHHEALIKWLRASL